MCVTFEPSDGIAQDTIMLLLSNTTTCAQENCLHQFYVEMPASSLGLSSSQMVYKKVEMSAVVR